MGVENVVAGHGLGIAAVGMSVVFAGLVLVSVYVALVPRLFRWAGALLATLAAGGRALRVEEANAAVVEGETSPGMGPELLAAIGTVIQAERERQLALDDQRITLRDDQEQRVWTAIGKMRTLSTRM